MDYAPIAVLICGLTFFTRAAAFEKKSPWTWGGLSLVASLLAMFVFNGGWLSVLFSQAVVLVAITLFRAIVEKDQR